MNQAQPTVSQQEIRARQQTKTRPSPAIQQLLGKAVRYHRAGRLTEAARIYRQILAVDAEQADSLHLLGMIAFAAGGHDLAVAMIRKAIAIKIAVNDDQASYHSNLGTVLQAQGKLEEAATSYERALILQPELAEVHLNLGNVFLDEEKLVQNKPDQDKLGQGKHDQEKLERARSCYERALALNPHLAEAHHSMGNVLQAMGENKLDEAVGCYERALALKPSYAGPATTWVVLYAPWAG